MKLILVSQNKRIQHEYNGLILNDHQYDNGEIIYKIYNGNERVIYGEYKNKEKPQKIMNEVLDILKCYENINVVEQDYFVYEFPKE